MANFAPLINDKPIDPVDNRLTYGLDFINIIGTSGTLTSPSAALTSSATSAGVSLTSVAVTNTSQVTFIPTVASSQQAHSRWDGDGKKFLVTVTVQNSGGKKLQRSGKIWIAQR